MTFSRRAGALAASLALSGMLLGACAPKPDKAFGDKVRAYLLEHPEVLLEVSAKLEQKQAAKTAETGRKAIGQYRQAIEPRQGRCAE